MNLIEDNLNKISDRDLLNIAESLQVLDNKKKYNKQEFLFPDKGPFRRELYKKHVLFFKAGSIYKERALIAANRTGKTYTAAAEMAWHLNGKYPKWWEGKRFDHPIIAWESGKTNLTTRDILQRYLIGDKYDFGTGMIPKEDIEKLTTKAGVPDAVQDIYVKHYTNNVYDGLSLCSFKSYDQGVEAFMGASIDIIHLDEEPVRDIYSECVLRTMTTHGIIICTFTPLLGLSEVVLSFLPGGKFPIGGIGAVNNEI